MEQLLKDWNGGRITRRNFLVSIPALAAAARGMAQTSKPTIPVRALNHVTMTVSDPKRSLAFYVAWQWQLDNNPAHIRNFI